MFKKDKKYYPSKPPQTYATQICCRPNVNVKMTKQTNDIKYIPTVVDLEQVLQKNYKKNKFIKNKYRK